MSESLDIYCIAIGGTGMAPLACLLRAKGHQVRGVDRPLYPPMSTLLERVGITPLVEYQAEHLEGEDAVRPDLVIVGNAVPRHNEEVQAMERLGLPHLSMPQALARFILADRKPLVLAGTHGKTTTTSMASWVYSRCGQDPGYLIGGMPLNLPQSFHVGTGERFIIEGDEYNAAYFDRGPKFLHYRPRTVVLTSVEYDHADLYPNPDALLRAYRQLVDCLSADGLLIACGDQDELRAVVADAACKTIFYGLDPRNDVHPLRGLDAFAGGCRFQVQDIEAGEVELDLAVPGEHNALNAMAVWISARLDGIPAPDVAQALGEFRGVKRRLEELGEAGGVVVVDDFAHHPTAVGKSLGGLRDRYPDRRLIALFEPRSLTAGRAFFYDGYVESFAKADVVLFAPIFYSERLGPDDRLDLDRLCSDLRGHGTRAERAESIDDLLQRAIVMGRDNDVMVTMSSGSFEGLPHRILEGLRECS